MRYGHGSAFFTATKVFTPLKLPLGWGFGMEIPQNRVVLAGFDVLVVLGKAINVVVPGFARSDVPEAYRIEDVA